MRRLLMLAFAVAVVAGACTSSGGEAGSSGDAGGGSAHELTVSAASSLTNAFTDIGHAFERRNPDVTVRFNFGASDTLANQIDEGAPVDVFASASPAWMDAVENDGPGVTERGDFARNKLAIIVPKDDPAGISKLEDLTADGVKVVIAAEGVPAGDYAREIFDDAGITDAVMANVASNEEDVRAVVTKVLSGDADAGVTYVTDVTPDIADRITLVEIPDDQNVIATYPIAVVSGSREADLAKRFVHFVLDDAGHTLARYGFVPAA